MKKKLLIYLFILTIITSCGFKVVNYNELLNFQVNQINSSGNKFINYKLKNKLNKFKNNSKEKLINVNFDSKKEKIIKEKNIKNEITKYELSVLVNVRVDLVKQDKEISFQIEEKGDFSTAKQYTQTLDNEKKIIETLIEKIYEKILENLIEYSDEL